MYDYQAMDTEIRRQRRLEARTDVLTDRMWSTNADGSADPHCCSFERIFDAFTDYINSRRWN